MKAKGFIISFISSLFLIFVAPVFAVTLSIDDVPSSIDDQPFTIKVSVSGASEGENYLRADLYKEGTTNYFGETNNGSDWYNGSTGTN